MIPARDEIVAKIRTVAEAQGALLALLFGSVARGTETVRSDLDLIIVEETSEPFLRRIDKYFDNILKDLGVPVDVLVYTPSEFRKMREGIFMSRALAEGQVIHGSAAL